MDSLSIADIDAKILALQAAHDRDIRILLRQRNTLAPISTLPTEILCTIFVIVKSACRNVYTDSGYQSLDWVKVTHVCRRWREIGIQACCLWNEISLDCANSKWATEMLARSKASPLIVTGRTTIEYHDSLFLEPLHFARIHELNIHCLDYAPLQGIWRPCSVPDQPLPLHTVRLELKPSDEEVLFPDALGELESHLPSLRRILLSGCSINWNAPFWCNITHLRLSEGIDDQMECYRTDFFLEALKTMPMLEMLYFSKWASAEESELSTARKIPGFTLPNLKFLAVVADIDPLGIILHAVSLPSILATCLYIYERPSSISDLSPIFSSLLAPPQPPIRTLEIRHSEDQAECRIRSWPVALSQMDVSTLRVIPTMQTTLTDDPGIQEISFIAGKFCSENLVSLSLPQIPPTDAPTWARTFGTLSALQFININGENAQSLFEALIYFDHESPTIPFPSLLSISIEDMDPVPRQDAKAGGTLQDSLIGALIERYELGREIREIIFVDLPCRWNNLVCRIREVVVDVDVVEEEFWKERSRPTSRIMYPTNEDEVDQMTDWMGFWS